MTRLTLIAVVVLGAFALASYSVLAVVDSRARNVEQRVAFCLEIEKLKAAQRQKANENYRNLRKNARILGIKVTPELVRASRESRDRELRRFAARSCG